MHLGPAAAPSSSTRRATAKPHFIGNGTAQPPRVPRAALGAPRRMSSSRLSHLAAPPSVARSSSAARPGSAVAQQLVGLPLPLIKCDDCWWLVLRWVSTTDKHPGWVFYKCEKDKKGCNFWYWEEEYIDLLIQRGLLDVGALVARDEITEDTMSKFLHEEAEKKQVCRAKKSTEKGKSVGNEHKEMEKVLIALVVAVKEVVFLLKCVIVLVVLFGSVLLVRNW